MPEDQYFRPRNWGKFQSRSNNSMSWVKLQTSLLSDPDYSKLTENQRLTWVELLALTGRTGKPLPLNSRWIGSQLARDSRPIGRALPALLYNNFIELCDRTANLHDELPPPRVDKRRVDKRRKKEPPISPKGDDEGLEEFLRVFPKDRKGARGKIEPAWRAAKKRDSVGAILAGTRDYAESDEVARGFAKGAAAWLNDNRWKIDYRRLKKPTTDDLMEDFVNGHQGSDSRGREIDGECVEVPRGGFEANGHGILPGASGPVGRRHPEGGTRPAGELDQDDSTEAGGLHREGEGVAALVAQTAQALKAGTKP